MKRLWALVAPLVAALCLAGTTAAITPSSDTPLEPSKEEARAIVDAEAWRAFFPGPTLREPAAVILNSHLRTQYDRSVANGWVKIFKNVEADMKLPKGILLAVGSRETNLSNVVGDGGHGRGVFQIDDRFHQSWLKKHGALGAGKVPSVWFAARYAARILVSHHERALAKGVPGWRAWKYALAAYNAGFGGATKGYDRNPPNVDFYTAHGNYGFDTQSRMRVFRTYLDPADAAPGPGGPAVGNHAARQPRIQLDTRNLVSSHGAMTPRRIVLHSTENYCIPNSTSEMYNVAVYWNRQRLGIGAHLTIDCDGNTALNINDRELGYHVKSRNTGSLGIEQVAQARMTRAQWLANPKQLEKVAKWIAYWSIRFDIPIRMDSEHGVTDHRRQSILIGGGHWDVGYGYPFEKVLAMARNFKANGWR